MASYLLRFRLLADAPDDAQARYAEMYEDFVSCDSGRTAFYLSEWAARLAAADVGNASDRQQLNRCEGGLGGNDNHTCRHLRPFMKIEAKAPMYRFNEITLIALSSGDGTSSVWEPAELQEFADELKQVLESQKLVSLDSYIAYNGE